MGMSIETIVSAMTILRKMRPYETIRDIQTNHFNEAIIHMRGGNTFKYDPANDIMYQLVKNRWNEVKG